MESSLRVERKLLATIPRLVASSRPMQNAPLMLQRMNIVRLMKNLERKFDSQSKKRNKSFWMRYRFVFVGNFVLRFYIVTYISLTNTEIQYYHVFFSQAYYFSGRQLLNDADFDLLKEDLSWNGSPVVQLNRKEATYLAAVEAYLKGKPIMSNADFDALKAELKEEKSRFAVSTEPKCFLDSGICTVTLQDDFFRSNLLYLPALSLTTILWLGFGFEILEPIIRVNPLFLLLLGFPITWTSTKWLTDNFLFKDNKIVYGPCPACGAENRIYFGDILLVEGFSDVATTKCPSCKVEFNVQRKTLRASTLATTVPK